jgi:hypothetical protein
MGVCVIYILHLHAQDEHGIRVDLPVRYNCSVGTFRSILECGKWELCPSGTFAEGDIFVAADMYSANIISQAGGALLFVVGLLGWYITFVIMAAEMRLKVNLPVGDLSHFWPATDVPMADAEKQA